LAAKGERANVANIVVSESEVSVEPMIPLVGVSAAPKKLWGLSTEEFQKVSSLMLSPNCWEDSEVGSKHYFFMLCGCTSDDPVRGFFNMRNDRNETADSLSAFLNDNLTNRKCIEISASASFATSTPDQLSGLGFSRAAPRFCAGF
jgi:hypothetical protein